jgi:hypothetical protein
LLLGTHSQNDDPPGAHNPGKFREDFLMPLEISTFWFYVVQHEGNEGRVI